jgi:hypothetical protein
MELAFFKNVIGNNIVLFQSPQMLYQLFPLAYWSTSDQNDHLHHCLSIQLIIKIQGHLAIAPLFHTYNFVNNTQTRQIVVFDLMQTT